MDKDKHNVEVDPEYADDIMFVGTDKSKMNQVKRVIPKMLEENNLFINTTKTEKCEISRISDNSWKKCKLLGFLLDTEKDIK